MAKKINETGSKADPFVTVSKQLPFYPDQTEEKNEPFEGSYVSETELGDDPDPKKHIPVYVFANADTGEEVFITKSYAIQKAVEAARRIHTDLNNVVFRFEFLGKGIIKKTGKPFNQFNTSYCTLEQYQAYRESKK